jgi:hypothetical protein
MNRIETLAEKTLEATAGNTAVLGRIDKTLDKHEKWLLALEEMQIIQKARLEEVDDKVAEHIKCDMPVDQVVGKWSARIVWAALTAAGGLVVAYLHKLFGTK